MAVCDHCKREMLTNVSCNPYTLIIEGITYTSVPYSTEYTGTCHDCGTPPGSYHHPGCDFERCPHCNGFLMSCSCDATIPRDELPVIADVSIIPEGVLDALESDAAQAQRQPAPVFDAGHLRLDLSVLFDGEWVEESGRGSLWKLDDIGATTLQRIQREGQEQPEISLAQIPRYGPVRLVALGAKERRKLFYLLAELDLGLNAEELEAMIPGLGCFPDDAGMEGAQV